jgi:hypothetical protein
MGGSFFECEEGGGLGLGLIGLWGEDQSSGVDDKDTHLPPILTRDDRGRAHVSRRRLLIHGLVGGAEGFGAQSPRSFVVGG